MEIKNLRSKEDLKELVIDNWGYTDAREMPSGISLKEEVRDKVIEHKLIAEHKGFLILYFKLDEGKKEENQTIDGFLRSTERVIISSVGKQERRTKLFIFSSSNKEYWHFINASDTPQVTIKRFVISPDNRDKLRTATQQLKNLIVLEQDNLQEIITKLEVAFSVEEVSINFFNDFKAVFDGLKSYLISQDRNTIRTKKQAHDFALRLLNRLMFLYFVQKKGIFNNHKEFIKVFWNQYRNNYDNKDLFFENWLKVLFFNSLNGNFSPRDYFKPNNTQGLDLNTVLITVPHLNGGLFRRDELDELDYEIEDEQFMPIFSLLESYNFTVRESTPLDQDLDIDPEIMGNIYEMLVNVSETEDEQHQLGIFYTQKVEINLMLRRSLIEYLYGKTKIAKEKIYQYVFLEKEIQRTPKFTSEEIKLLEEELNGITIADPACGSGHYLVVATQLIWELLEELARQSGKTLLKFEIKKKILQRSIYGVDVKEWAVEIAKLRLWLDLIVDATDEQLKSKGVLLPNLTFKIRVGDSIVQEVGGIYFSPSQVHGLENASLRSMLVTLKDLKKRYFNNDPNVEENQVIGIEKDFYKSIVVNAIEENKKNIYRLEAPLREKFAEQLDLVRTEKSTFKQPELPLENKKEIERLIQENSDLEKVKDKLIKKQHYAFWPIEFSEIFADKEGFDIVIANPPYVRQELICDPTQDKDNNKKLYKDKLEIQIQKDWGNYSGKYIKISKKSDLYVYFYLKSLQLLNSDGVLCFISSNSWLDVKYGKNLQDILLRYVPIVAIYDNEVKRSFKHADINTIIFISRAPHKVEWTNSISNNLVKFVMFKKPYEEVSYSDDFVGIEFATQRTSKIDYKLHVISQKELYMDGCISSAGLVPLYSGNKWGAKYLRAPDIYFEVNKKVTNLSVRLEKISFLIQRNNMQNFNFSEVVNENYKLNNNIPFLHSLKDTPSIRVNTNNLPKSVIKKNAPYVLPDIISNRFVGDRLFFIEGGDFLINDSFFIAKLKDSSLKKLVLALINSSIYLLYMEIFGRKTYAIGVMYIYGNEFKDQLLLDPLKINYKYRKTIEKYYDKLAVKPINSIFDEYSINPKIEIRSQIPKPNIYREKIDNIVFNILGIKDSEKKREIYWSLCELVNDRLEKAKNT